MNIQEANAKRALSAAIKDLKSITVAADIDSDADAYVAAIRTLLGSFFGDAVEVSVVASTVSFVELNFGGLSGGGYDAVLQGHVRSLVEAAKVFA